MSENANRSDLVTAPKTQELDAFAFTIKMKFVDEVLVLAHDVCGWERRLGYPASIGLAVLRAAQHTCDGPATAESATTETP